MNVEFEEKATKRVFQWAPRWADLIETIGRAYEVEAANEAGGHYERILDEARSIAQRRKPPQPFEPDALGKDFGKACQTILALGKEHFTEDYVLGPTELKVAAELVAAMHVYRSADSHPARWCFCPHTCGGWHKIGECCPSCRSQPYYRK